MDQSSNPAPWFCPFCGRTGTEPPTSGLCAHCGTRVEAQGYCPVCEDYRPQEVGAACAKHDVELEAAPPEQPEWEHLGPWVEVGRYSDALDCQAPRIRLEGEGIPTSIQGERMGSRSMYQVATGGVSLRVPESLAADARVILAQTWTQDAAALGIEDDDWDEDGLGADAPGEPGRELFHEAVWQIGLMAIGGVLAICLVIALGGLVLR